jgi:8-oxo-dGTP pyrophosphatase MutT (NUDIX family)
MAGGMGAGQQGQVPFVAEAVSAVEVVASPVAAAGGVVWRLGAAGAVEVVLVHRPKYDDWSLPKGKRDPGETDEDCALREVAEETGLTCTLGPELDHISCYIDRKGRPKEVRWWVMSIAGGAFEANDEVDEVCWLSLDRAERLLSYDRDREVLAAFAAGSALPAL